MSTPIRRIRSACCARAANGHAAKAVIACMNLRRRITFAQGRHHAPIGLDQGSEVSEMGSGLSLHGTKVEPLMSDLGHSRPIQRALSAG
jgi:hypothetical protein